ncbi:retrovirus-related pol polyprotein from transposon TNT 1-94 [Tanacetum coccineum]
MAAISMDGVETSKWHWCKVKVGLSDAFLYAQSASELWKEIGERSQILAMDPLPTVNKAYYIVQQIEKQKQVIFANMNNKNNNSGRKDNKGNKNDTRGEGRKKAKKGNRLAAQVNSGFDEHFNGESPFDLGYENEEMMKLFKGKGVMEDKTFASSSHAHAGILSCFTASFALSCHPDMNILLDWISDLGASDHMSLHLNLFISTKTLKTPIIVHLPDGSYKTVTIVGQVQLTPSLILTYVFYVLDFQLNLLSVVDDHTRATWTYLVHSKGQIHDLLVSFLAYLANHFNGNGTETVNATCSSLFQSKGILHQKSMVYTPQQNGRVERKHRHLLDTARTIRLHANLPITPQPLSTNAVPPEQVKRSTRQTTKPVWLKDFVDPTANKSTPHYPLFVSTNFLGIPKPHIAFLANVFSNPEPSRYKQAVQYSGWRQAMDKELVALEKNNTWTLTVLPPRHKPISSKWVYKTKYNPDGTVERLKARLVVRGFNQQEGLDYKHTFSPVAKLATIRVLIAIDTAKQWPLH